jgi:hypothetical protein
MERRVDQIRRPLGIGAVARRRVAATWHRWRAAASAEIGANQAARGETASNGSVLDRGILILTVSVHRTDLTMPPGRED